MSAAAATPSVSSSSTLWATASKEWVIPAKPKPGRKPKKDAVIAVSESVEVDNKGRRVQNRAAQRAFRERKQSQLSELQARLQQYEQGEIERNVALQNIAKRLKEDNEKLRKENSLLNEKIINLQEECDGLREKRRWRSDSLPRSPSVSLEMPARKKAKVTGDPMSSAMLSSYASSPSSGASSPDSDGTSHTSFSPAPALPNRDLPMFPQGGALSNIFDFVSVGKSSLFDSGPMDEFDCGFCNETTPCLCREIAVPQNIERVPMDDSPLKLENQEDRGSRLQRPVPPSSDPLPARPSILDNLPAYQPPVPLRRRAPNPSLNVIFPISSEPNRKNTASCSGDPSNCSACADDAFGKAFCLAIGKSASKAAHCGDCPDNEAGELAAVNSCCGNPAACSRGSCGTANPAALSLSAFQRRASTVAAADSQGPSETIPCDDAWRQIKSHPNVAFADLTLLAEVVARRTRCTGPRVEICPAPGTITPERGVSPIGMLSRMETQSTVSDSQSILLTDPHAHYREKQWERVAASSPPPRLVPQEVLIRCGRRRIREVDANGVRDALRLLDAKFSAS